MPMNTSKRFSKSGNEYFVGGHASDYMDEANQIWYVPNHQGWVSRRNGKQTFKYWSHREPKGLDEHFPGDEDLLEYDEEERRIQKSFERKEKEKEEKRKLIDEIKKFNICGIRPSQDININSSMKDIKKEFSRLEKLFEQRNQSSLCMSIALDEKKKARECMECGCSEIYPLLNQDIIKCGCDTCLKDGCIYTLSSPHNGEDILSLFKEISPETFLFFSGFLKIEDMINLQKVSKFFYSEMKVPIKYLHKQLTNYWYQNYLKTLSNILQEPIETFKGGKGMRRFPGHPGRSVIDKMNEWKPKPGCKCHYCRTPYTPGWNLPKGYSYNCNKIYPKTFFSPRIYCCTCKECTIKVYIFDGIKLYGDNERRFDKTYRKRYVCLYSINKEQREFLKSKQNSFVTDKEWKDYLLDYSDHSNYRTIRIY